MEIFFFFSNKPQYFLVAVIQIFFFPDVFGYSSFFA